MDFTECLKRRLAKEVKKDEELIKSILKTSQNKLDSENKLELSEITSSSKISLLYDSLRELLEALTIKKGYKIYNHECYTYFLKEIMNESSKGDEFDELRKTRNSLNYYQKNNVPPRTKVRGLKGTCFLDARSVPRTKVRGFQTLRHGKEISVDESKEVLKRMKKLREEVLKLVLSKKRAFIIHRWDGNPKGDWYPWLKKELEKKGFEVEVPEMPNTSEPKINDWINHLKKVVGKLDNETYFIGHSIGCQTIMRFLEKDDYNGKIENIVFVAGWFKLNNLENKEVKTIANPWINTHIDFNKIKPKLSKLIVFLSDNDPYNCLNENKTTFKEKLNAKVIILKDKGHFTEDSGVIGLPEILKEIN